jgi:hypothetical protein
VTIGAFLNRFVPFNRFLSGEVSFVFLFIHFFRLIRCECPAANTVIGQTFENYALGTYPVKLSSTGCYLIVDCTFRNGQETSVVIAPISNEDLYSSGCAFIDCRKSGEGACFYFNRYVKSTIIRTCVTRCGANVGGFIWLPTQNAPQTDLKEISTFQTYPDSSGKGMGGNWFRYRTSRFCISNVNITEYNAQTAVDRKGTILWNTPGDSVS